MLFFAAGRRGQAIGTRRVVRFDDDRSVLGQQNQHVRLDQGEARQVSSLRSGRRSHREVSVDALGDVGVLILCSFRQVDYTLAKGTTEVLSSNVKKIQFDVISEKVKGSGGAAGAREEEMELA